MTQSLPPKLELLARVRASRSKWGPRPSEVEREPVGPGEESVWDYPRPPIIEPVTDPIRVVFAGEPVATSNSAVRVLETAGAPVYYLPPEDVRLDYLHQVDGYSICEWKGAAVYFDIRVGARRAQHAAFAYPDPFDDLAEGYGAIAGWMGFYAGRVDACYVGEEKVEPQPGGLYAGWITQAIKGPIKGVSGSSHW